MKSINLSSACILLCVFVSSSYAQTLNTIAKFTGSSYNVTNSQIWESTNTLNTVVIGAGTVPTTNPPMFFCYGPGAYFDIPNNSAYQGNNKTVFRLNRPGTTFENFFSFSEGGVHKWVMGMDNDATGDFVMFGSNNTKVLTMKTNGTLGIGVLPEATLHIGGNFKLGDPNYNGRNWTINSQNWMDGGDFFINPDKSTDGTDDDTKGIRISRTTGNFTVGMYNGMTNVTTGRSTGLQIGTYTGNMYLGFNAMCDGNNNWTTNGDGTNNGGSLIWNNTGGELIFSVIPRSNGSSSSVNSQFVNDHVAMQLKWNANVGAGQVVVPGQLVVGVQTLTSGPHTDFRLSVDGKLVAKEIYVTNTDWADYVFNSDYKLMSLDSLEKYIDENKHLPNVPTTEEVMTNGNNAGETDKILLEKVEELTLYLLQMNKKLEELEVENKKLKELIGQ